MQVTNQLRWEGEESTKVRSLSEGYKRETTVRSTGENWAVQGYAGLGQKAQQSCVAAVVWWREGKEAEPENCTETWG